MGTKPCLLCIPHHIRKEAPTMMSTAPPLLLSRSQAGHLQGYIQTYRHYAFASIAPSTGRNNTLRILQAVQGKFIEAMDQQTAVLQLIFTEEEIATLKT